MRKVVQKKTCFVVDDDVVLGCHVISNVVVNDETQQPVEQSQIDLLVHLLVARLQHDVALSLSSLPHVLQVVDSWRGKNSKLGKKKIVCHQNQPSQPEGSRRV